MSPLKKFSLFLPLLLAACSQVSDLPPPTQDELLPEEVTDLSTVCRPLQMILPLYIYPGGFGYFSWQSVARAGATNSITAIVNPASGPGNGPNADYIRGLTLLRNAKVNIIGYVYSNYSNRPLDTVKAEIDIYHQRFGGINGIFIDTVGNTADRIPYYSELYNYIKSLNPNYKVFLNPGTVIDRGFFDAPAGDVIILSEDFYSRWLTYPTPGYVGQYPPDRMGFIAHTASTTSRMQNALALGRQRNMGWAYVTHGTMPNPWLRLASYWSSELSNLRCASR